jgi:hypothetical protein
VDVVELDLKGADRREADEKEQGPTQKNKHSLAGGDRPPLGRLATAPPKHHRSLRELTVNALR